MGVITFGFLLSTLSLYTSDAFIPNLSGYPCIVSAPIAKDSVVFDYTVSQAKDGEWSLSYDIQWSTPMNLTYGVYFSELSKEGRDSPLTPWSFVTCKEVLEFAEELEEANFKTEPEHLSHARFTSRYMFQVSYGEVGTLPQPVPVSLGTTIFFETPDCYTITDDVEFCSSQDVYRCGVPTNVRLVEVTPGLINGTVMAYFEWASPVQVNRNATVVEYRLQIHSSNGDLIISDKVYHSENGTSYRWVANLQPNQDEPIEEGLSFKFMIVPYITYIYDNGSLHAGRKSELKFWSNLTDLAETTTGILTTSEWTNEENENQQDFQPVGVTTRETPTTDNMMVAVISIISSLSLLFLILIIVVFLRKRRSCAKNRNVELDDVFPKEDKEENIDETSEVENEVDLLLKDKEVSQDKVFLYEKLGEGEFGVVYKGVVQGINRNNKEVICAVKMPKVGALYDAKEDLLSEMKLVADLGDHPNILGLVACCSRREPYYLVTEFMKYGDLLTFLRKCRQRKQAEEDPIYCIEEPKQVFIAYEIAKGMAYIQEKLFYHGDLAARNIIVGDGLIIKISDFGLADDIYTRGYKRREIGQKIPIKWCSLETILKGMCTSQGDVWSYGVLLYEIFTLGGTPYPGIAARYLVSQLRKGYRMEQPEYCPDDIYELMLSCWKEDPNERPTFHVIGEELDAMLVKRSDYLAFEQEDESFNDTCDEKGKREYLRKASCLSNIYIQNFKLTSPVKQNDDKPTETETFAPILEEENDIELTELEAIIHNEQSNNEEPKSRI